MVILKKIIFTKSALTSVLNKFKEVVRIPNVKISLNAVMLSKTFLNWLNKLLLPSCNKLSDRLLTSMRRHGGLRQRLVQPLTHRDAPFASDIPQRMQDEQRDNCFLIY